MDSGWDSLLRAVFLGRLRLTRLLLEGGAYINESDRRGLTPLMISIRSKHQDSQSSGQIRMVRYLLENGADPNIQDSCGQSSLVHAVLEGAELETLSLLVAHGADPTLPDHRGASALVHAVKSGHRSMLRLLVDACRTRGQEVVIVTTDSLHTCQHFMKVPPSLDQQGEQALLSCDCQCRSTPQGALANASLQLGSPLLGAHGSAADQDRLYPLQHSVSCLSKEEEPVLTAPKAKHSLFSRRHSIDARDTSGFLSVLQSQSPQTQAQNLSGQPQGAELLKQTQSKRVLGRKMSYDGATTSQLDRQQEGNLLKSNCGCVSSLANVIRRRNIGVNHYSSDSQLVQDGGANLIFKNGTAVGLERRKLDGMSTLIEKRSAFERKGSGALLLDHIAHTRPGFLPPLNPHTPIPDIAICSSDSPGASGCVTGSGRRSSLTLSKLPLPCAPLFPKDVDEKKLLLRRHSMQSEQIRQLSDFEETFSH